MVIFYQIKELLYFTLALAYLSKITDVVITLASSERLFCLSSISWMLYVSLVSFFSHKLLFKPLKPD